jgi:hypothetical protein
MMDEEGDEGKAQDKDKEAPKKTSQGWGSPSAKDVSSNENVSKPQADVDDDPKGGRRKNLRDMQVYIAIFE